MDKRVEINISEQRLRLFEDGRVTMDVAVSTARNGAGEVNGSECTPRGAHIIRAKIGADAPSGTVRNRLVTWPARLPEPMVDRQ